MDTARAFVGCLLDLGTTRKVAELGRGLRTAAGKANWEVSWVPPPNLHVTLKFLGDIDIGLVAPLSSALAEIAQRYTALRVSVGGVSVFPSVDDPAVLFTELIQGHGAVAGLARAVDEACNALGFAREVRGFHGHVTLGRVRRAGGALGAIVPVETDCGVGMLSEVALYRSDDGRPGVEYTALARYPLEPLARQTGSPREPRDPAGSQG